MNAYCVSWRLIWSSRKASSISNNLMVRKHLDRKNSASHSYLHSHILHQLHKMLVHRKVHCRRLLLHWVEILHNSKHNQPSFSKCTCFDMLDISTNFSFHTVRWVSLKISVTFSFLVANSRSNGAELVELAKTSCGACRDKSWAENAASTYSCLNNLRYAWPHFIT